VPASDWVIMSLMTGARALAEASRNGDGDVEDFEGPFAPGGLAGLGGLGASTETAHSAVEAAAAALAAAEEELRAGEKQCHGAAAARTRVDAQVQAACERLGAVLATAHASGVADWPEVSAACEDAELSLGHVKDGLSAASAGSIGGGGSGSGDTWGVASARAALDRALSLVDAAESLVTDAWQRHEQRRAELVAAADLTRDAIARTADAKEAAQVLDLGALPAVAEACAHAERSCQAAALAVRQADSLPLAVVTDDARRAGSASLELERVVATQRKARDHFDEAERQRVLWKRSAAQQRAAAAAVKVDEEQRQVRSLRDQLEAVHLFLARAAPDLKQRHASFERAHDAIVAAQQQLSGGASGQRVPVALLSGAVQAAVGAVEAAVAEQAASARAAAQAQPLAATQASRGEGRATDAAANAADANAGFAADRAEARVAAGGVAAAQVSAASAQVAALNEELLRASRRVASQHRTLALQAKLLSGDARALSGDERAAALAELSTLQTESV
jgi:hypothetical protein